MLCRSMVALIPQFELGQLGEGKTQRSAEEQLLALRARGHRRPPGPGAQSRSESFV